MYDLVFAVFGLFTVCRLGRSPRIFPVRGRSGGVVALWGIVDPAEGFLFRGAFDEETLPGQT